MESIVFAASRTTRHRQSRCGRSLENFYRFNPAMFVIEDKILGP